MRRLPPGWPLGVVFLGFPVWWLLGLANVMFMLMAAPMAVTLWQRRRTLVAPGGFGAWLFFLVWVMLGVGVLWADAPGAVPGGGLSRSLVFGWRMAWYIAFTIVLLYIGNLSEKELPTGKVGRLLGFMFVVTAIGGLVGAFLPTLQLHSLLELLLPHELTKNAFIRDIIHPKTAEISTILGFEESRPMAPFAYANTWGAAYAFFLPYFVLTWIVRAGRRRRIFSIVVLLASFWPAVYSLNRGLWLSLGLVCAFGMIKLVAVGRRRFLGWAAAGALTATVVIALSPLPGMVQDRLANPHSNNRRSALAVETVESALEGSPLVGFGSTRNVQGDLNSVAGGDRPDCPACGSPPLGTQGHLWLLIFAHGLVGTVAFCAFFLIRFARHWRDRSAYSLAGCSVLLACALFLFTYDLVEVPLYTVMVAVALMWRAKRDTTGGRTHTASGARTTGAGRAASTGRTPSAEPVG